MNLDRILAPRSLGEMLQLLGQHPDAVVVGGGSSIIGRMAPQHPVISTHKIAELKRITRSEGRLDVGASVSVARVLRETGTILPHSLVVALEASLSLGQQSLASLCGALCRRGCASPVAAAMSAVETQLELRRGKRSRWIATGRALNDWASIGTGSCIYRMRIPLKIWTHQITMTLGNAESEPDAPVSFCGLAKRDKHSLIDIRMAFCLFGPYLLRSRELENDLKTTLEPLGETDAISVVKGMEERAAIGERSLTEFERKRIHRLTRRFFASFTHNRNLQL